ncbi:MAG: hypothetical protein AB7T06_17615 [Kofleriaceae bacterium]
MSKGKKPLPERSKIERAKPLAYQRRASDDAGVVSEDKKPIEAKTEAPAVEKPETKSEERATGEMAAVDKPSEADAPKMPADAKPADAKPDDGKAAAAKPEPTAEAKPVDAKPADAKPEAKTDAKAEAKTDAKAEAKPEAKSHGEPERASRDTMTMPAAVAVGAPPEVPSDVENPTFMPSKDDLPAGAPTDPAKPPGGVPQGDSRSLRRGTDFALIYRQGTAVITRFGVVGQRGQWRVVEYPTPTSASNAYAKQCSQFVGEGFSDYRD